MEIKQDLDASTPCPGDRLIQDCQLPLYIWVTVQWRDSPIANGDADMIQPSSGHLAEVILCDPGVPVVLQIRLGLAFAKSLRIGILVDYVVAQGEDGRGDPWFKNEPTAKIYTTDFVIAIIECNVSLAKPAKGAR